MEDIFYLAKQRIIRCCDHFYSSSEYCKVFRR